MQVLVPVPQVWTLALVLALVLALALALALVLVLVQEGGLSLSVQALGLLQQLALQLVWPTQHSLAHETWTL